MSRKGCLAREARGSVHNVPGRVVIVILQKWTRVKLNPSLTQQLTGLISFFYCTCPPRAPEGLADAHSSFAAVQFYMH